MHVINTAHNSTLYLIVTIALTWYTFLPGTETIKGVLQTYSAQNFCQLSSWIFQFILSISTKRKNFSSRDPRGKGTNQPEYHLGITDLPTRILISSSHLTIQQLLWKTIVIRPAWSRHVCSDFQYAVTHRIVRFRFGQRYSELLTLMKIKNPLLKSCTDTVFHENTHPSTCQ